MRTLHNKLHNQYFVSQAFDAIARVWLSVDLEENARTVPINKSKKINYSSIDFNQLIWTANTGKQFHSYHNPLPSPLIDSQDLLNIRHTQLYTQTISDLEKQPPSDEILSARQKFETFFAQDKNSKHSQDSYFWALQAHRQLASKTAARQNDTRAQAQAPQIPHITLNAHKNNATFRLSSTNESTAFVESQLIEELRRHLPNYQALQSIVYFLDKQYILRPKYESEIDALQNKNTTLMAQYEECQKKYRDLENQNKLLRSQLASYRSIASSSSQNSTLDTQALSSSRGNIMNNSSPILQTATTNSLQKPRKPLPQQVEEENEEGNSEFKTPSEKVLESKTMQYKKLRVVLDKELQILKENIHEKQSRLKITVPDSASEMSNSRFTKITQESLILKQKQSGFKKEKQSYQQQQQLVVTNKSLDTKFNLELQKFSKNNSTAPLNHRQARMTSEEEETEMLLQKYTSPRIETCPSQLDREKINNHYSPRHTLILNIKEKPVQSPPPRLNTQRYTGISSAVSGSGVGSVSQYNYTSCLNTNRVRSPPTTSRYTDGFSFKYLNLKF